MVFNVTLLKRLACGWIWNPTALFSRLGIIRNHQELKVKWSWAPARSFLEGGMEKRQMQVCPWIESGLDCVWEFFPSHLRRVQPQTSGILVMANSHKRDALCQTLNNVISVCQSVWRDRQTCLKICWVNTAN